MKESFQCTKCKRVYRWFMRGGTAKLIGHPMEYSDKHVTECAYCVGVYADSKTICNSGKTSP